MRTKIIIYEIIKKYENEMIIYEIIKKYENEMIIYEYKNNNVCFANHVLGSTLSSPVMTLKT